MFTKKLNRSMLAMSAAFTVALSAQDANAAGGNTFNNVWGNLATSITGIPQLITIMAYLFGIVFAVLGVLKIKEHVENPQQTPLKDGVMKFCAGGAMLTLPFIMEIITNAVDGDDATNATAQSAVAMLSYTGAG